MGPDKINQMVLKEFSMEFATHLTKLFRESMRQKKFQTHGELQALDPLFKNELTAQTIARYK